MDLARNSIRAQADRICILVKADSQGHLLVSIEDNGYGMSPELLEKVQDPFTTSRTTRKVGMGIPFFRQASLMAGGEFRIDSVLNHGTQVEGSFVIENIDRIPLGDIGETVKLLIMCEPDVRYILKLSSRNGHFTMDTDEIKENLGDAPISQQEILEWIRGYINENVLSIFGGVLNEVTGRT